MKDAQSTPKVEEKITENETENYKNTGNLVEILFQIILRRLCLAHQKAILFRIFSYRGRSLDQKLLWPNF